MLAVPLATAAFPSLSSQFAGGDGPAYARTLLRSTRLVVVVSLAGAAVLVAVAPAVGGFFAALDVAGAGLSAMPVALTAFAPGLVGFALIAHLGRALFAAGHAAWAARSTVAGWLCAVVLSLVLVPRAGRGRRRPGHPARPRAGQLARDDRGRASRSGWAPPACGSARRPRPPPSGRHCPCSVRSCSWRRSPWWRVGVVTDRVLDPGIAGALVAGVVGSVLAGGVLVVGLAVVDREDLRTLLRRGA